MSEYRCEGLIYTNVLFCICADFSCHDALTPFYLQGQGTTNSKEVEHPAKSSARIKRRAGDDSDGWLLGGCLNNYLMQEAGFCAKLVASGRCRERVFKSQGRDRIERLSLDRLNYCYSYYYQAFHTTTVTKGGTSK